MMEPEIYTHLQNVHEKTHHPTMYINAFILFCISCSLGRENYSREGALGHIFFIVPAIKHES